MEAPHSSLQPACSILSLLPVAFAGPAFFLPVTYMPSLTDQSPWLCVLLRVSLLPHPLAVTCGWGGHGSDYCVPTPDEQGQLLFVGQFPAGTTRSG
jgi:hypothetical protein